METVVPPERPSVERSVASGIQLAYKGLLTEHRGAMVTRLTEVHEIAQIRAVAMIDQLWVRLTRRIVKDYQHLGLDLTMAERIMNEALGFLALCARESGHGPAELVDIGWHTIILYTLEYEALCVALAGHMINHCPTDVEGLHDFVRVAERDNVHSPRADAFAEAGGPRARAQGQGQGITDTVAAMQRYGPVDLELWRAVREDCVYCTIEPCVSGCDSPHSLPLLKGDRLAGQVPQRKVDGACSSGASFSKLMF
jgi:hypothetical protein